MIVLYALEEAPYPVGGTTHPSEQVVQTKEPPVFILFNKIDIINFKLKVKI